MTEDVEDFCYATINTSSLSKAVNVEFIFLKCLNILNAYTNLVLLAGSGASQSACSKAF